MELFDFTEKENKISNADYHSRSELSKSDLDLLEKSPYHYKHKKEMRKESYAFDLGSLVHTLVLEPEMFEKEYVVSDAGRNSTLAKECDKNNKTLVSEETYKKAVEMADSVLNSKIGKLFQGGVAEETFFGEIDDVKVRCRPDYYREDLGLILDLKTTNDASKKGFVQSCGKWNYYIQDSFYSEVVKQNNKPVNDFLFIAVEKEFPYMVGCYRLGMSERDLGVEHYTKLIELYKYCEETGDWGENEYYEVNTLTGEVSYVQDITLPSYVFYKEI